MADQTQAAPLNERGYVRAGASTDWWSASDNDPERTPELQWPANLEVYDRMRSQDAQVMSVLRAVTHPVRRVKWRVDPAGASPRVVEHVARDLGLPVKGQAEQPVGRTRDRFSWGEHLQHALLELPFGHMVFEQVYRIGPDGLAHLRKLGPRMPLTLSKFDVATDGGLVAVHQKPVGSATSDIIIPIDRLVVYVNEREGANWTGRSLLRSAYKNWLIKDRLLRTGTTAIDRNGMGIPVYTGAEGETDLSAGLQIASDIRAGDESGASIPHGAQLALMGVSGQIPDALPMIRYQDEQIARAVLAHFLNLGTQTGSWALGSTLGDFFTQSLQSLADQIADVATQHIVEDLVDLNWGPDEPAPRITCDEIGSATASLATAIQMLVNAGVLTADDALEAYLRMGLGLPPADDATARSDHQGGTTT